MEIVEYGDTVKGSDGKEYKRSDKLCAKDRRGAKKLAAKLELIAILLRDASHYFDLVNVGRLFDELDKVVER